MEEFFKKYDKYSALRPLKLHIEHIRTGVERWRVHIFEHGTAPTGGDREIVFAEDANRAECFRKAAKMMEDRL